MLRMVSVGSAAIFECTDAVGAERGKLAKMQAADLRWRQLPEGCGQIFPCEFAVARQDPHSKAPTIWPSTKQTAREDGGSR